MRKIFYILMVLTAITINFSCEDTDDFLNKEPLGDYSENAVWSDPNLIETFVNSMYRNALGLPFSIERLSDYSDESFFTPDWDVTNFNKSLITSDGLLGWQSDNSRHTQHFRWAPFYSNIRRANIFFTKINTVTSDNPAMIERLKGEAYFLRAWTYFYLTNLYGGVPIIIKAYGLNDDFEVPRNTYEECINYIIGQVDSAVMYLPEAAPVPGRVNKGAAQAFKSRVLLYAASDLHNPQKNSAVISGFSNPELLGYTGGDAVARWTAAKNAAKAVIDSKKYSLFKADPNPGDSIANNFVELFISKGTEEDILLQFFSPKTDEDWQGYNPALYSGPNGYHNWGNNTPLGELVDEYEMKDGSAFNWNNAVQKANPYVNREARFYATVLYEGVQWRVRPSDALKIDPFSMIQVGHVYDNAGKMIKAGLDTREGPIEDWNGGKTGYYLRKFNNPAIDPQYVKQDVPFKHIRYAEILLNYAEACIELGEDAEARTYINMIRKRAGQPELAATITGDAFRQAYRHERRLELAFEDHRFWDVRRWIIGPAAYHQTHGVDVRYVAETTSNESDHTKFFVPPAGYTGTRSDKYRKDDGSTWGAPVFSVKETPGDARAWNNKMYFFPIMRDEMNKNTKLIQNPGY